MSRHRRTRRRPSAAHGLAALASLALTGVVVGGGVGLVPETPVSPASGAAHLPGPAVERPAMRPGVHAAAHDARTVSRRGQRIAAPPVLEPSPTRAPADSGQGRRVVFSESAQRVWLVEDGERVLRSYLVSGSVYDNLDPGTYAVYSRSEQAWGIDDSGTMEWFVRFARGDNAAIGFHDIPEQDGRPIQSLDQLGTPLSHGCIRQREDDAKALWDFAPLGTTVVVIT